MRKSDASAGETLRRAAKPAQLAWLCLIREFVGWMVWKQNLSSAAAAAAIIVAGVQIAIAQDRLISADTLPLPVPRPAQGVMQTESGSEPGGNRNRTGSGAAARPAL